MKSTQSKTRRSVKDDEKELLNASNPKRLSQTPLHELAALREKAGQNYYQLLTHSAHDIRLNAGFFKSWQGSDVEQANHQSTLEKLAGLQQFCTDKTLSPPVIKAPARFAELQATSFAQISQFLPNHPANKTITTGSSEQCTFETIRRSHSAHSVLKFKPETPAFKEKHIKIVVNDGKAMMNVTVEIQTDRQGEIKSLPLKDLNHQTKTWFESFNPSDKIEIFFTKSKTTVTLPQQMNGNLVHFLKRYKPIENSRYCCVDFACEMVLGRNAGPKINYDLNRFDEKILNVGDIVYLKPFGAPTRTGAYSDRHFAIYIGHSHYLSLLGTEGPLSIMTLPQINKKYATYFYPQIMSSIKKHDKPNNAYGVLLATKGVKTTIGNPLTSLIPAFFCSQLYGKTPQSVDNAINYDSDESITREEGSCDEVAQELARFSIQKNALDAQDDEISGPKNSPGTDAELLRYTRGC